MAFLTKDLTSNVRDVFLKNGGTASRCGGPGACSMLRLLHTSRCGRPRATAAVMGYESEDGLSGELLGIMII